ncbi:MAG: LysM peptidoglycan-binding domain-containing protein [Anaerolineae bacterium]|nr:LysM peptidoglycan-binding domain-containing protein [Anaerolineae bacterium]
MFFRPAGIVLTLVIATCVLSFFPLQSQAQTDASCPALVELALSQVGNNCGNLDRNTACYGFNRVDATFGQAVAEGYFTRPAEITDIATMKTIRTAPLDLGLAQWGIAVMKIQANIPDTLPGQAVTFLLVGDTEVENAVISSDSNPVQPITVIIQSSVDLRVAPEADSQIVGNLPSGTVLQADGLSLDGLSLRVLTNLGTGWIDRSTVNQTESLNNLPIASTAQSPMQAFYFRTGAVQTTCGQTPSLLAIQSPENLTVDLTANGANIRLGSLATLQTLPSGDQMKLTVLEGKAVLEAGTPNEVTVFAGNTTTRCLLPPNNLGSDDETNDQIVGENCPWTPPQPITIGDLEQGQSAQAILERIGLAHTPIATPTAQSVECPFGTTLTHTVSAGENLYRISLRYRTSMGAIMTANNITNSQLIYVGQRLAIPCGVDTGIPSVPSTQQPGQPPATLVSTVDCSRFRATSPLDGLPYGSTTFYWDPAGGATGYRVNLYNLDEAGGALVGSFGVGGDTTSVTANLSIESVGYGFSFAWEVQALFNGQAVCTSARVTVPRAAPPASCPATSSC